MKHQNISSTESSLLGKLLQYRRTDGSIDNTNGTSLLSEIELSLSYAESIIAESIIADTIIRNLSVVVDTTPDYALKRKGKRVHPDKDNQSGGQIKTISQTEQVQLPKAYQHEHYKLLPTKGPPVTLSDIGIKDQCSSINSLYKDPLLVTTAPYKLLSCCFPSEEP